MHGVEQPASTTSSPDEPPTAQQRQPGYILRDVGNVATTMIGVVGIATETGASDDEEDTMSVGICGGAAMIAKRVEVDIMDDNTDLSARRKERVADEETGSGC